LVTGVQLIEQRALVALRAEHCDPHRVHLLRYEASTP
jgi:hypothetical protein